MLSPHLSSSYFALIRISATLYEGRRHAGHQHHRTILLPQPESGLTSADITSVGIMANKCAKRGHIRPLSLLT
jgi:hypothetical protein